MKMYFVILSIFVLLGCGKKHVSSIAGFYIQSEDLSGLISLHSSKKACATNNRIFSLCLENAKQGDRIIIPAGEFHFSTELYQLRIPSNVILKGMGRGKTLLVFHPTTMGIQKMGGVGLYTQDGSHIDIEDFTIHNVGSDNIVTKTMANTVSLLVEDSKYVQIRNVEFVGGHFGVLLWNTTMSYEVNRNITIEDCNFSRQASSGLLMKKCSRSNVKDNTFNNTGSDGLKTSKLCKWLTIENNISEHNRRDGFDFYDGCLECSIIKNKAIGNYLHGFDLKGNPDANGNFVFRDNIITDNIASGNGYSGFSLQNVRKVILIGNLATKNMQYGYYFNNVQSCTFSSLQSSENMRHGYLLNKISRSSFTGCTAIDNGQSKSLEKYNGFHLNSNAGENIFEACVAINGTNLRNMGSQEYGFFFENESVNNKVRNSEFRNNRSGNSIGGDRKSQLIKM